LSSAGRRFSLSDQHGHGVSCDQAGVFVGAVPLLEPCRDCGGFQKWRPRPMHELNPDLSKRYGVPIEFDAKLEGLAAIARALDRGDLLHAHIAHYICRFPIHRRLQTPRCPRARWLLWRKNSTRRECSRGVGTRRSTRVGRQEAPRASGDASRRLMRLSVLHRVTDQALRPERRRHRQYRLRP
jgi:hypothetical protein